MLRFAVGSPLASGPADYFAPKNWKSLDNGDLDLGTAPIAFDLAGSTPSHLAIAFGKDGNAYLLDRTALGNVSNAIGGPGNCGANNSCQSIHAANNEIISAPVLYTTATATYVAFKGNGSACTGGTSGSLTAITDRRGSPPSLAYSWCARGRDRDRRWSRPATATPTPSSGRPAPRATTTSTRFDGDTGAPIAFTASNTSISDDAIQRADRGEGAGLRGRQGLGRARDGRRAQAVATSELVERDTGVAGANPD